MSAELCNPSRSEERPNLQLRAASSLITYGIRQDTDSLRPCGVVGGWC